MSEKETPRTCREKIEMLAAICAVIGLIFSIYIFVFPRYILDCDNDGIHDHYDACENPGCNIVDSSGCPRDSDGDGLEDCIDDCPLQKGDVINNGCPPSEVSAIIIYFVNYDAEGNDNVNLNGEWVEIYNISDQDIDMLGWKLYDESQHCFAFPYGFVLKAGQFVKIYTGSGENTASELYWGRSKPVWTNDGDCVFLVDENGTSMTLVRCEIILKSARDIRGFNIAVHSRTLSITLGIF
jgi:hypothetical protein